jgi:predicted AAA+ superfamily ATPase
MPAFSGLYVPLDARGNTAGPALKTLVLQEITALNSYLRRRYLICYWRSAAKAEVDFILYGEKGFFAIEVTGANRAREEDIVGLKAFLKAFLKEYPQAKAYLLYCGEERYYEDKISVIPLMEFFKDCKGLFFQ